MERYDEMNRLTYPVPTRPFLHSLVFNTLGLLSPPPPILDLIHVRSTIYMKLKPLSNKFALMLSLLSTP